MEAYIGQPFEVTEDSVNNMGTILLMKIPLYYVNHIFSSIIYVKTVLIQCNTTSLQNYKIYAKQLYSMHVVCK